MHPLMTIEGSRTDKFPFKKGDRIKIRWRVPVNKVEFGNIHELLTSIQWGHKIVHGIIVKVDGKKEPFGVCGSVLEKVLV